MSTGIYVGDIVRLSEEHGGLLGTLSRVRQDEDASPLGVVQLSGAATIIVPASAMTYAGPPIPPEPEAGAMVLVGDVPYKRGEDGWHQMGRSDSPLDTLSALFFDGASADAWGRIVRRHGHVVPQRLMPYPIVPETATA